MKYKLLKNIRKYGQVFKAGETIEVSSEDIKAMIEAGLIEGKTKTSNDHGSTHKKKKKTTKKLEENGDIDSSNNNGKR
tara:strand:- start:1585 stop:1818 length:234 start_codon:yes stop_codon:yes gene_type:complete